MQIDTFRLFCDKCRWVEVKSSHVRIKLDLETYLYHFEGICSKCMGEIVNARKTESF